MAKKILIVDDEPDILMLLSFRLKAGGYEVLTAMNSREALAAIEERCPDLILLDLLLPETEGDEIAKRIKANGVQKHIPIILLTACLVNIDEKVRECRADDYCLKPFEYANLLKKIEKSLKAKPEVTIQSP